MPYLNEHAARIKDPKIFDKIKRQNNKFGEDIDVLWGIKDSKITLQAIRFNSNKYSVDEAKKWLKEHDYKYVSFEEAIKKVCDLLKELKQNNIMSLFKGGPGSGPREGQKNRLGTGNKNNEIKDSDNYRTTPKGKFGEGYWITDSNDYIDITDDFGSASNDHVGVISAGDNKDKLGLNENDVKAINDSYDSADVTDESIEATNKIFNNGNIRARFFNDGTLAITARELNDNTKSKIIRLIEDKKIKPKEILYESNNQIDYKILTLEELFKFQKGGSGSGNFGHSGRPGEVGGSSVDNLSSYQDKNPKGEFDEKSIDQLRETPKDFSGKFVSVSNASQEYTAKLIDEYNRVPDIVKNATDEIIYNNQVNIIDDTNGVKYKVQAEAKRDSTTGKRNVTIYGKENEYRSGSLVHELGHNFIESSNAARNAFIFNLDKYKLSGLIENEKTKFGHPDPVSGVFARFFNTAMIHPHLLEANYQHLVKVYKNTLNTVAGKELYKNEKDVMDLFKGGPGSGPNPGQKNRLGTGDNKDNYNNIKNKRPKNVKQVNKYLPRNYELIQYDGYLSFKGPDTEEWYSSSVPVNRVSDMTFEKWINEFNYMKNKYENEKVK